MRDFKGVFIPARIFLAKDISPVQKFLLTEIHSLDKGEGCFASNQHLGDFLQIKESYCANLISDLRKKGYLINRGFNGRKRFISVNPEVWNDCISEDSNKAKNKEQPSHINEGSLHKKMNPAFTKNVRQPSQISEHSNTVSKTSSNTLREREGADAPTPVRRKVMALPDELKRSLDNMVCLERISDEVLAEVLELLPDLEKPVPPLKEMQNEPHRGPREKPRPEPEPPEELPKPKRTIFQPPTLEEAQAYFEEKGVIGREAEKFWNYYGSNGWKVGINKMKDWHKAAAGWISRMKDYAPKKQPNEPLSQEERNRKYMNVSLSAQALYEARKKEKEEKERKYNEY